MSTSHHGRSFGRHVEAYERGHVGYPRRLFQWLCRTANGRPILDVGCGTGVMAEGLVLEGCVVLGIEPDDGMATIARAKGIDVEVSTIEDWNSDQRRFGLAVAARSWHWVDPERGITVLREATDLLAIVSTRAAVRSRRLSRRLESNYVTHKPRSPEANEPSAQRWGTKSDPATLVRSVSYTDRLRLTPAQFVDSVASSLWFRALGPGPTSTDALRAIRDAIGSRRIKLTRETSVDLVSLDPSLDGRRP